MTVDAGPWRGPTKAEWLARISPWPTPWIKLPEKPLEGLSELEKLYLWGDR